MTDSTIIGPPDASRVPRFTEPATFARLPRIDQVASADVCIVGIPFDSGVSYRPGARFGPGHVRAASKLLRPYNPALNVEPFSAQQVADCGDIAVNPFDIEDAISTAVAQANKTVRNMDWFQVVETRGHIENGKIGHYQVTLKIGFALEK